METKDWEATIEVDRNDIEDDQLGFYNPIVAALAEEARKHPEKLVADLMVGGFSTACYDGQNFFATTHPVGAGTVSNFGGGAGTAWYLLDTSRMVKPFIFQLRRDVQLVRMDRQDDEHAFMRKKMRYGVDYRGAAAYGLWQMAYACKETLNDTNYAAARAAMMSVANAEGRPLGMAPNLLFVPPSLEAQAREICRRSSSSATPPPAGPGPMSGRARRTSWWCQSWLKDLQAGRPRLRARTPALTGRRRSRRPPSTETRGKIMAWFGGFTLETYNRIPGDYEEVAVGVSVAGCSQAKIMPTTGPSAHGGPGGPGILGRRGHPVPHRRRAAHHKQRPLFYQRGHAGAHRHPGHPAIPGDQVRRHERGVEGDVLLLIGAWVTGVTRSLTRKSLKSQEGGRPRPPGGPHRRESLCHRWNLTD